MVFCYSTTGKIIRRIPCEVCRYVMQSVVDPHSSGTNTLIICSQCGEASVSPNEMCYWIRACSNLLNGPFLILSGYPFVQPPSYSSPLLLCFVSWVLLGTCMFVHVAAKWSPSQSVWLSIRPTILFLPFPPLICFLSVIGYMLFVQPPLLSSSLLCSSPHWWVLLGMCTFIHVHVYTCSC